MSDEEKPVVIPRWLAHQLSEFLSDAATLDYDEDETISWITHAQDVLSKAIRGRP